MTALPIDFDRAPFKPKYIDEETLLLNRWFIFGERSDGCVHITDGTHDITENVPRDKAERLIAARNVFVDSFLRELNGPCLPEPDPKAEPRRGLWFIEADGSMRAPTVRDL